MLEPFVAPWFPTKLEDFNQIGKKILGSGDGIQETDHPGFNDPVYRKRRSEIAHAALKYDIVRDKKIPAIDYTKEETETWDFCYQRLKQLFKTHACEEFNWTVNEFIRHGIFQDRKVPQLDDISEFVKSKTSWRLTPVGGLLSQREFLNGLAFKVFHSTQYVRHAALPLYTPEPDIIHEIIGHGHLLATPTFIGSVLATFGAYWVLSLGLTWFTPFIIKGLGDTQGRGGLAEQGQAARGDAACPATGGALDHEGGGLPAGDEAHAAASARGVSAGG